MAEFKDFDEAIQADKEENVQFKVAGREYTLPATLPAKVVLTQMRYTSEGNEIPMNVLPDWISSLVGDSNFDQMLEDGMTWEQMNDLLSYLLEAYGLAAQPEEEVEAEGEEEDSEAPK